ncbi:RNA-binding protein [Trypanosoma theileri]|uniref:RNA-binding protein n=1 Tax=Trypanosoma theileri TaxID=67003 RepID=A0A1X0P1P6_9TRYP|nr:RNA-binding protein [Trypanosoma theileri]ORC90857.1 RNA-binding protein [Trypanosoma theileri]
MPYQNLFVAKLPRNVNDADLEQIFAEYFPISAKVMLDAATGKSKGFGFVLFKTEEEGRKAYEGMNRRQAVTQGHRFHLCVFPSQHSGRSAFYASNALYIRNIPVSVPQHQVEQFLASFGTLLYCAMREDHYGSPVWVVYAEYDCLDCSANALRKLHGKNCYFNGASAIMAKYADSEETKQERRRRREEGKSAPATAPAPRSACVFPPPPQQHTAQQQPEPIKTNKRTTTTTPAAAATAVTTAAAVLPVDSAVWLRDTRKSSTPDSNENNYSFGMEGVETGGRKSPAVVYRHNPYSLAHLEKTVVNQPVRGPRNLVA